MTPKWLKKYLKWCGTRSAVLQVIILAWTLLMLILITSLLYDTYEETERRVAIREMSPRARETEMGATVCCPFGIWFIITLPLGIAAIATLGHASTKG